MLTVTCKECGTQFEAQRSTAKFCSDKCRVKANERAGITEAPKEPKMVVTAAEIKRVPSDESWKTIRTVMDKINKDFGEGTVMILGDKPRVKVETISTGSLGLDLALGVGGLPRGRIVEIFGPESSGKTTLALHVIAEAQKKGLKCLLIDAEYAFDSEYAMNLGIDLDSLLVITPDYGEQGLEAADRYVLSGEIGVVVIDSVAALVPKGELEGEMGDSKMGLHARLMSQACRKMTASIARTNTLCIFINQLRNKIGQVWGNGNPEVTTGGMALQFYASVRLDVRALAHLKDGEETTGRRTKVRVVKNKVAAPYKNAEFDVRYGQGIHREAELVDIGVATGVLKANGSWYSHGDTKLGQGRQTVIELLEANKEFAAEIEVAIKTTQQ